MYKLAAVIIFAAVIINGQEKVIYENPKFKITASGVIEGNYKAEADENSIRSNYSEAFEAGLNRIVTFKFAINGADNERASGSDHKVFLNPNGGEYETPVYTFGGDDPAGAGMVQGTEYEVRPGEEFDVTFNVDMSRVLGSFADEGYYINYAGDTIHGKDFKGVYIAGGTRPLTWDFSSLAEKEEYKLKDDDGDGIYEITLRFRNDGGAEAGADGFYVRSINPPAENLPEYSSEYPLLNGIYDLSLEEMLLDIREDGAYMAGAKWEGVWTRDVSYSIILAMAIVQPDVCKTTLMAKVKNGMIIQDTGTGGAWPVSTDRMIWAAAAYEVYKVTGDREWLENIYAIISKSAEADMKTAFNEELGLVRGESSFLDWREQTYPVWMDPKDIYDSYALGTNAVHAETYRILHEMSVLLGDENKEYERIYNRIKEGINSHLWVESKGYYGQFIYGRNYKVLSEKSETLGEALTVLFGIAGDRAAEVIQNTPTTVYGSTCVLPQETNIPPYHNNAVWPFVEAYRMLAAKTTDNEEALMHSMASILRPAGLFLTNKENFTAETGSSEGTEINSDRQLWSVAGALAIYYRVLFGMEFEKGKLTLNPFIPASLSGEHNLDGFRYGKGIYDISVSGTGNKIKSFKINENETGSYVLNPDAEGKHTVEIIVEEGITSSGQNLTDNYFAPGTPAVKLTDGKLMWEPVKHAAGYKVYVNGKEAGNIKTNSFSPEPGKSYAEYQVSAYDAGGTESFLSEPVITGNVTELPAEAALKSSEGETHEIALNIDEQGLYSLSFLYANGSGPINTDNKCAIRSVYADGSYAGSAVLPQRGLNNWSDFGYSNGLIMRLRAGEHKLKLVYESWNQNMNLFTNEAVIKGIRLVKLSGENEVNE